jgi:hypothetical protein
LVNLLVGEYPCRGGGEDVDFCATLEGWPFQSQRTCSLRAQIKLYLYWSAVWKECVKGLLAPWGGYEGNALVGELVKNYLLIEFAGGE